MSAVHNGLGSTTAITYDRLNNNQPSDSLVLYAKCSNGTFDCGDVYPTQSIDGPFYLVKRVDASNGNGGIYSSTYAYSGGPARSQGRGFLGFAQMTVTDSQTHLVQTTSYWNPVPPERPHPVGRPRPVPRACAPRRR